MKSWWKNLGKPKRGRKPKGEAHSDVTSEVAGSTPVRADLHFAEAEPHWSSNRSHHGNAPLPPTARHGEANSPLLRWFRRIAYRYPARLTVIFFGVLILVVAALLSLPAASAQGQRTPFIDAFFTSVSAVTVTGLTVVDTATHWSFFGQAVILGAISVGGFGVVTVAASLTLMVSHRLGLTQRLLSAESTQGRLGDAGSLFVGVLVTTLVVEFAVFLVILIPLLGQEQGVGQSVWQAFFMAVSAFNNAGFVNLDGGMAPHVNSWGILLPIMLGAAAGAVGFPVLADLRRTWRTPRKWALHTKLTLSTYFGLVALSGVLVAALEWNNPDTFGSLSFGSKMLNSVVEAVNPRSLGISAIDVQDMTGASRLVTDISMFIGGGSGSHAGGIKVTTFIVLLLAVWAEARGNPDVEAFHRRIPNEVVRQGVAILLLAVTLVSLVVLVLLIVTPYSLDQVIFEAASAFGTVGLSTGITPYVPGGGKVLLAALMITGRVGPMTLAASLALRNRHRVVKMPSARPIVG